MERIIKYRTENLYNPEIGKKEKVKTKYYEFIPYPSICKAYISPVSFEYVWEKDTQTKKLCLVRKPIFSEIKTLSLPCAWKEETKEVQKEREIVSTYETGYDKYGKAKVKQVKDSLILENGGTVVTGDIVNYILSLYAQHELNITEDKLKYYQNSSPNKEARAQIERSKHTARFSPYDVANDVFLAFWSEAFKRVANKEKQFTFEEAREYCISRCFYAFKERMASNIKENSLFVSLDEKIEAYGEEIESMRELFNEEVKPYSEIEIENMVEKSRGSIKRIANYKPLYKRERIPLPSLPLHCVKACESAKLPMKVSSKVHLKSYIDKKYRLNMIGLQTYNKMFARVA
jgi:hypothetical protein